MHGEMEKNPTFPQFCIHTLYTELNSDKGHSMVWYLLQQYLKEDHERIRQKYLFMEMMGAVKFLDVTHSIP